MKIEIQKKIAETFPNKYVESELNIKLNEKQFELFKKGVFAGSMDEKWNILIVDNSIFFARSWTDKCIYKVRFKRNNRKTILCNIKISRDKSQYKSTDLNSDINMFKKILETYLSRKDLFVDKRINLPMIQQTIQNHKTVYENKNRIGSQSIELNLRFYDDLIMSYTEFITVTGIVEFRKNTAKFKSEYELLSLLLYEKDNPKKAITFFFNQEGTEVIGKIKLERKKPVANTVHN